MIKNKADIVKYETSDVHLYFNWFKDFHIIENIVRNTFKIAVICEKAHNMNN